MHFSNPLALLLLFSLPVLLILGPPLRGSDKNREVLSVGLRLILVACLILALAGLETVQSSQRLAVEFLMDASDSITPEARARAEAFVQAGLDEMGPDDLAGVIVFGREAVVERPLSNSHTLGVIRSVPAGDQTNLEGAIRLALALLPPDAARRIVLLSDGIETSGDGETAARLAEATGVQIVSVPLLSGQGAEVLVKDVQAPPNLRQGEKFVLQVSIEASQPVESQMRVFANGELVYAGRQQILRGSQTYSLPLQASSSMANSGRFIRYQVQIDPQVDGYYQNNQASSFSQIEGPPRLLVIAPPAGEPLPYRDLNGPAVRPDEAGQLVQVLSGAGFQVQVARPSGLADEQSELANFEAVILVDVPARELTGRQMSALQSYVRDLGRGLLAVGGPTSFGVGGYYRTPLEEILPVEMQMKDELRRPNLTMVFVIDHSGSMGESSAGVSKLELAKEAAIRSIELLNPTDRVGVIAFDDSATWVVPISEVGDSASIISRIETLRDGGGTDILAGLQAMAQALPDDPATVKHVILLTDGGANPAGIPELVTRMNATYGITLSAVGVGSDAAPYLANLAQLGGGRYHFAADPGAIPRIFTEETSLASRSYIIERTFTPVQTGNSPILAGSVTGMPALSGYIGATARPVAQTVLVSDLGDPILATWQYGLGRAVAFTSDASSRWAASWLNWQGFPGFWVQVVQYLLPASSQSALSLRVEQAGEQASLIVDAQGQDGAFLNGYRLQANIAGPGGAITRLDLVQDAPGQYVGSFTPEVSGVFLIGVTGQAPDAQTSGSGDSQPSQSGELAATAGWVRSYSPEYGLPDQDGSQALAHLAEIAGGWLAGEQDTSKIFTHDLPSGAEATPVWPWLLTLATLLLPFDIAVRRLALTPAEIKRAAVSLVERLAVRPAPAAPQAESPQTPSLSAFRQAKDRVDRSSDAPTVSASHTATLAGDLQPESRRSQAKPDHWERQAAAPDTDNQIEGAAPRESSTAASLLAAKKKRKGQQ